MKKYTKITSIVLSLLLVILFVDAVSAQVRRGRDTRTRQQTPQDIEAAQQREKEQQKKIDEERAARQKILDIESKNGLEPNSEDMAFALGNMVFPGCSKISFTEFCTVSYRNFLRIQDSTKIGCKQVVKGKNYKCEYKVRFECRITSSSGISMENPQCAIINNSENFKTGFILDGKKWKVYKLDKDEQNQLKFPGS